MEGGVPLVQEIKYQLYLYKSHGFHVSCAWIPSMLVFVGMKWLIGWLKNLCDLKESTSRLCLVSGICFMWGKRCFWLNGKQDGGRRLKADSFISFS